MKILLTRPAVETRPGFRFPLGLGYIAAVLVKAGHEVDILDLDMLRLSKDQAEDEIKNYKYDIFGLSSLTAQYRDMKWMISISKKWHPEALVVIGGAGPSSMPEFMITHTKADIVVLREGEETIIGLLTALEEKKSLDNVKGILYKKEDGSFAVTSVRERISNLDIIPFPEWNLFDMKEYSSQISFASRRGAKSMVMITSRGCPFNCAFCFRDFGRRTIFRSARNVVDEIKKLKDKYDIEYISFLDELFTASGERVKEICDRLIDERIKIKWDCRSRVDSVEEGILKKMKAAGCVYMSYGIESASDKILKNMDKGIKIDEIRKAITISRKVGIKISGSFMIGMTGETEETFQATVNFIKEMNMHKNYGFFYTTPFPGTKLFEEAIAKKLIPDIEQYIMDLGETHFKPFINLSNLPFERLSVLKTEADKEIEKDYKNKNPFWPWVYLTERYRLYGFLGLFKKVFKKIRKTS
ncbi:MAG: radical SAM protein [Candidatus Omnitrophica bacterium]|jgi:radical SAM superfamily enzyme YgiQ (UPF0313 family)|nr:radical SAM protein [Candidatus Omnitrophota bacterium]